MDFRCFSFRRFFIFLVRLCKRKEKKNWSNSSAKMILNWNKMKFMEVWTLHDHSQVIFFLFFPKKNRNSYVNAHFEVLDDDMTLSKRLGSTFIIASYVSLMSPLISCVCVCRLLFDHYYSTWTRTDISWAFTWKYIAFSTKCNSFFEQTCVLLTHSRTYVHVCVCDYSRNLFIFLGVHPKILISFHSYFFSFCIIILLI